MIDEDKQLEDNMQPEAQEPTPTGAEPLEAEAAEPAAPEAEAETAESTQGSAQASAESMAPEDQAVAAGYQVAMDALTQENESLKAQLEQFEDLKTQYARLAADFDNFRKRTQKEKEDLDVQARCAAIKELLPTIDNFERARSQIKPKTDGEMTVHKSYQSVYKQMVDCLKRLGVAPMRPEGQPFDPNLHDAVMREPSEEYPEDTVIEELMRGYTLGDRILRHAMVKVAAAPEPVVTSEESSSQESSES
jgi:molecular chaperone GrpE